MQKKLIHNSIIEQKLCKEALQQVFPLLFILVWSGSDGFFDLINLALQGFSDVSFLFAEVLVLSTIEMDWQDLPIS